jgi:large subunit ribosomal protein L17
MRHRVHGKKLNRSTAHRRALRRNLARSLFATFGDKEYIVTTQQKVKFAQPFVENLITLAREKTLHRYRRGIQLLRDESLVHALFEEIGPRYRERHGGYTRILKTGRRRLGDKARLVLFGFVQEAKEEAAEEQPEAEAAESTAKAAD